MSTEIDVTGAEEVVIEVPEITITKDDQGNDTTDWKAVAEANRELALKNQGIAQRFKTKLGKTPKVEPTPAPKIEPTKPEGLGYAEKAFLVASGIKGSDEVALVEKAMKSSGDTLEQVLENDFFQGKLKSLRDDKAALAATPSGTRRSTQTPATDTVEYWSDKYASGTPFNEIPDAFQTKVLNAKIAKEKSSGSNFSRNPIIGG